MNHTIANIRQLFNVKNIAYSTTLDNLAEGQFGIFADGVNTSVATGVTFATLPAKFRIFSRVGGKLYYSADVIDKTKIVNGVKKPYTASVEQVLGVAIKYSANIKSVALKINIDEASLMQRDGLTWTHADNIVEVTSDDLAGYQIDPTKILSVYENNVITKVMVDKIVALASPYYTAEVGVDSADVVAYANLAGITGSATPFTGKLASATDTKKIYVYDGAAWQEVGLLYTGIAAGKINASAVASYLAIVKTINTDATLGTNDSKYLQLILKAVAQPAAPYRDLEVNYIYPRGVKLSGAVNINNGDTSLGLTSLLAPAYEVGAGADLRALEFESMSLYTNLNFQTQLSDGIAVPGLVYQFENGKNYNTISLEFTTDKTEKNAGDKRLFGVVLGIEQTTPYNELVTAFGL